MNRWLRGLNPEQKKAVETTEGPLLVLAGAGSGKTRVITHRVAYLLDQGVAPEAILGVTFTNKAAEEMRERLRGMVGRGAASKVTLSTFHSLGLMMLKQAGGARQARFSIFDTGDQLGVLRDLLRRTRHDRAFDLGSLLSRISAWKNDFLTAEQLPDTDDPYDQAAATLYPLYCEQLAAYAAVDFDDLVCEPARRLSEDPAFRRRWQGRFRYLLVDEYQDTNGAQMRLLRGLVGASDCVAAGSATAGAAAAGPQNICVVGDDDQAIYGWRGADVRHILRFAQDFPGAEVIYLQRNYRSVGRVLELANQVIEKNPHRHDKRLIAHREYGDKVRLLVSPDGEAEAAWVAEAVKKAIQRGRRPGDIAVLYRSNILAKPIEGELRPHGVPYRVLGGQAFYERKEVKDLLAYLRLCAFPRDELALRRVINTPPRGIGARTVAKLTAFAEANKTSFAAALGRSAQALADDERAARAVDGFVALIKRQRARMAEGNRGALVAGLRALITEINLEDDLRKASTSENGFAKRWAAVEAFVRSFEVYLERVPGAGLSEFLAKVALSNSDDDDDSDDSTVTLSSLHGAKGLEWPLVFLVGLEEGFLPHDRTVNPQSQDHVSGDLAEERRLLYVGITRARDELVLTRCAARMLRGKPQPRTPSRFLDGIDEETFQLEDLSAPPEPEQVKEMMANLRAMLGSE
jgi:superfamily I DNA/RNA helicase